VVFLFYPAPVLPSALAMIANMRAPVSEGTLSINGLSPLSMGPIWPCESH